ncbi:hypothetical protein EJ07DRAFT_157162 [Lizonia empirigonia]|nr:hypothetical protein EJ07DRAFT_157162 [Lizonia empirigonia]
MFPHPIPPLDDAASMQRVLSHENTILRAQVHNLGGRVSQLEAENAQLRSIVASTTAAPQPAGQMYAARSDNAIHLPMVIESLLVMQGHFHRQGTLKQCSTPGCNRYAFDQTCFREGHMAWCRTHNRIITRTYISCSVKSEARGDCLPVFWEDRSDWAQIVACAFQEGKIGHKGLPSDLLNQLLFAEVYNPSRSLGPPVSLPQGRYPHGDWS